ncbi:MAG: L-idonate 5-dehydrogenase [Paenibacillus sp.]|nr:L-idonate 5-dehydrogenase [Paenibacillus sp.]
MKGKAVVFTDRLQVEYKTVDIPDPGDQDVVVEVLHSWISIGTESSYLRGERIQGEVPYQAGDPWPFPIVAGYQKTGIVRTVGKDVRHVKAGDRVFVSSSRVSGMFSLSGGHINPAVAHANQVWKLPEGASEAAFSGMVLTQVGFNCGTRPPVVQGDTAVVIGDGLVGHWTAQTLAHRGARVIMLGRHASRLAYLNPGVQGIDINNVDFNEVLRSYGSLSVVVDTVGAMQTVEQIEPFMERNSHWVSAGFLGTSGMVDIQKLRLKEMTLHTPSGWTPSRMDETLKGIHEGWLSTEALITHRFPVEQADKAWQIILSNKQACLGVVLDW